MKGTCLVAIAAVLSATLAFAQTGKPDEPDWITATNQPCKIWNPQPQPNESVTWSGGCKDGYASGQGVLKWTENGKPDVEYEGGYQNGKRNGHGTMITPDGKRVEGVWIDDKLLGNGGDAI